MNHYATPEEPCGYLKSPVSIFGSKRASVRVLLQYLPPHQIYVEPFAGGASLFFAKPPVRINVLNDINGEIINFYNAVRQHPAALKQLLLDTLYSDRLFAYYKQERESYQKSPPEEVSLGWAVAFIYTTRSSFLNRGDQLHNFNQASPRVHLYRTTMVNIANSLEECAEKLKLAIIKETHYMNVLALYAKPSLQTLLYIDPPYVDTQQKQYNTEPFTQQHLEQLCNTLIASKTLFMMSHIETPFLQGWVEENKLYTSYMPNNVNSLGRYAKAQKGEVVAPSKKDILIYNFKPPNTLFS